MSENILAFFSELTSLAYSVISSDNMFSIAGIEPGLAPTMSSFGAGN